MDVDKKIQHLVVDASAFFRHVTLHEIGVNIYTLPEVIAEIRDKATKERLQFLPYKLEFREPSQECIKFVTDFSKKTGDYPALSATDLKLLALVYQLEKEFVGIDHLRTEPAHKTSCVAASHGIQKLTDIPGFFIPRQKEKDPGDLEIHDHEIVDQLNDEDHIEGSISADEDEGFDAGSDDGDDDDDDEKGWVNSENIKEAIKEMGMLTVEDNPSTVACITTDFAMQNVLIQIGLHAVSFEGFIIRQAKTFILRCYGCYQTTSIMTKKFCPRCGNQTLKKVAVVVKDDGTKEIQISFRRPIKIKGLKHSLPMPRGGKHANNPVLFEDQSQPQNRPSMLSLKKTDALDPDYIAGSSPFVMNDVYSRAAKLGIYGRQGRSRRNHNPAPQSRKKRK